MWQTAKPRSWAASGPSKEMGGEHIAEINRGLGLPNVSKFQAALHKEGIHLPWKA